MVNFYRVLLKKGLCTIATIVLSLGPFITASGGTGIYTGSVSTIATTTTSSFDSGILTTTITNNANGNFSTTTTNDINRIQNNDGTTTITGTAPFPPPSFEQNYTIDSTTTYTTTTTTDTTINHSPSDLSPGQRFASDAISNYSSRIPLSTTLVKCETDSDFQITCNDLPLGTTTTTTNTTIDGVTLQNLSPQAAIQAETTAITSPYQFIRSINDGMQLLIAGRVSNGVGTPFGQTQQPSFLLRTFATAGGTPSFSAYGFIGPFGVSLSGGGSFGSLSNAQGQTGFRVDTQQANLMIDYSFNEKLIGGFSFGYLGADRNLKLGSGSLNSDSYRFAPFLLYRPTANSYLNVMGGYALANYDSTRSVTSFNGITFGDAKAKYDSDQFFASVGGGYTLAKGGWSLRGYARGDYSHIDIKSFQEKGGLATGQNGNSLSLAMQVNKQNIQSVTSTLGAELSHAISTRTFIPVIIPRLRAEWVHEFENDSRIVRAGFIDQNGANLTFGSMAVAGPVRNWANLGAGVQMLFARSIVGYVNYDRLIMSHAENNTISGGIRMNF